MRDFRLARVAAEAEILRLREYGRRAARRAAYAVVAVLFLIAALLFLHLALWQSLQPSLTPLLAALVVGGADLLVAVVLTVLALRSRPGRAEREAHLIRRAASAELAGRLMVVQVFLTVLRMMRRR